MNGHIIPGTPIAVDFWKKRECPSAKFFFLSHLHGDHTVGLSSSWQHEIYCSEITSKLLINKFSVREALVNPMEMGRSHIIYMDEEKQEQLVVSLIDANHCPGSVMFLFEGYFGRVLYTGDFRFCDQMFIETPLSDSSNIDMVYLDNTYCAPQCNFPTRDEAINQIIALIRKHDDCRIVIGMRQLGKEQLLVRIAQEFQEWISVPSALFKTAEILGLPNVFCVDDKECKIRVVPFHSVTRKNVLDWNDFEPTLAILPTSLYVGLGSTPYENCENIHVIPYSDHSSFNEICNFVEHIKPKFIHPIVNERKRNGIFGQLADRSDVSCLNKYLSKEPSLKFSIPSSVKKFMALPMNTYCRKIAKRKRKPIKGLCNKKGQSTSLGVVFESPSKFESQDSCHEFDDQLNKMKNSFKNTKQKTNHQEGDSVECQNQESKTENKEKINPLREPEIELENISPINKNDKLREFDNEIPGLCVSLEQEKLTDTCGLLQNSEIPQPPEEREKLSPITNNISINSNIEDNATNIIDINESKKIEKDGIKKRQKKIDLWVKSGPETIPENTEVKNSWKQPAHPVQAMDLIYDMNIPTSVKVKMISLKPLNRNTTTPPTSDLCVFPIIDKTKRKRSYSDNEELSRLKKFRT